MQRTRTAFLAAFVLLAAIAAAQPRKIAIPAKKALTHEKLWLMKRVGSPIPSPDGRWVVASVTEPSYDEKEQSSDLWLMPADGSGAPRQITHSKAAESDVTWSPDSHTIAFSSKREGDDVAQVYLLDVAGGGEARRVTSLSTGARGPQFRPDGAVLSVQSTVYPGAADDEANKKIARERKEQKYKVRAYDSFPIRHWDRWLDDLQTHLVIVTLQKPPEKNVVEQERVPPPHDIFAATKLAAMPGFANHFGEGSREEVESAWTPDGNGIVFSATTSRNVSAYAEFPYDLYLTDGSGEPKLLTDGKARYGSPRFSPDGKTLFVTYEPLNRKLYNNTRIVRYDWPSMANRKVVTDLPFDRSVSSWSLTPDGSRIYFTAEDAGQEKVYSVPAAGGEVKLFLAPERGVVTGLRIAERTPSPSLVALWGSSVNPAEVVNIDPATRKITHLTDFNVVEAQRIDWLAPEHFWFTSKRGRKIHSMLIKPAAFDESKKYPLFVLIHGGPAGQWRDQITLRWNYHLLARPGYALLLTDYVGSTGYGEKFAQDIEGDPLKGPGEELNEAADEAIKRYPFIDATRQAAGGASYGGHLAYWLEATTTRYKCIIAHAGLVNLESQWGTSDSIYHREVMNGGRPFWEGGKIWSEQSPVTYAAKMKTPILLSVGERDFRVPMNNTLEAWAILQRQRVPSRLLVWPDENHWILNAENSRYFYNEVWDWLAKWI
jgi:dipeptidyl aminopeptidase/acylaminoacyl peptidase